MSDTRAAMRSASLVVLGSALVGVLAGVLWAWWAPSAEQVAADGQLAVISDAWLGAIGLGCGAVVGLVASSRVRRHPFALIGGLLAGAVVGVALAVSVGLLLGQPQVRALPVLLAWPIAGMIAVVAVGFSYGLDDEPDEPDAPDAPDAPDEPVSPST